MKKHFHLMRVILLLSSIPFDVQGQIDPTTSGIYNPVPQAYQFVRYGNTPVHLNTGLISLEIPVFTYSDADFKIPVSLSYISEGFKPQSLPGILGMNWFLNAGGVITREIKGAADDLHQTEQYATSPETGYYSNLPHMTGFLKRRDHPQTYYTEETFDEKNHAYVLNPPYGSEIGNSRNIFKGFGSDTIMEHSHTYVIETESDLYHFNFMGYKGTFMIDGRLNARVINCENAGTYKIDLSGVSIREWSPQGTPSRPSASYIIITDGNGYKYKFGGLQDYLEYTGNYTSDGGISPDWAITSWKLNEITAPNGRTVTFSYNSESNLPKADHKFTSGCHILNTVRTFQKGYDITSGTEFPNDYIPRKENISTWNAITLLKSIRVDGRDIFEFEYTDNNEKDSESAKLKKITVKNEDKTLLNLTLDYEKHESSQAYNSVIGAQESFSRYWLKSIRSSAEGTYVFSYYHPDKSYPHYLTTSIDHWGYWNVIYNYAFEDLIPDKMGMDYQDNNGDVHINEKGRRAAYPGAGKYGLLKQVVYPTGGTTNFEYEDHHYAKRLERPGKNFFLPALEDKTGLAGGGRIKKITDCDSIPGSPARTREFFYVNDVSHIGVSEEAEEFSSGILLSWPRYYYKFTVIYDLGVREYLQQLQSTTLLEFSYGSQHIEYGKVFEKRSDGSVTEYNYSTYEDYPDVPAVPFMHRDSLIVNTFPADVLNDLMNPMSSRKAERGLLQSKIEYDSDKNILIKEFYWYNTLEQKKLTGVYNSRFLSRRLLSLSDYFYKYAPEQRSVYLGKIIKHDYTADPSAPVISTREFIHGPSGQLRETSFLNSDGNKYGTLYKYVSEPGNAANDPVRKFMQDSNFVWTPVETLDYMIKKDSSDTLVVSAKRPDFGIIPGAGIKQTRNNVFNPLEPLPLSQYRNNPEAFMDTEASYLYTPDGKIKEITRRDGSVISYLWGYKGIYPIAAIQGIKYEDLNIPASYTENSNDDSLYESVGNQLRLLNPQGQIYTFTYIPSVGIRSKTDPAGRTVRYAYDPSTNRLVQETDMDGNIIQSYRYNVINP